MNMKLLPNLRYFIFLIVIEFAFSKKVEKIVSVSLDSDENLKLEEGIARDWVAKAKFTDNTFEVGWSFLEVETNPEKKDELQSFAAGYVEGSVSYEIIYNSWRNTQEGFCKWKGEEFCKNLRNFLYKNNQWMREKMIENQRDPYWHHVKLILSQLSGLSKGYNDKVTELNKSSNKIPYEDFLLMNLSGDLEDLSAVLDPKKRNMTYDDWLNDKDSFRDGHCSALIKVLPGNKDLLTSHVTWNSYQSMLRVQKKYIFSFHGPETNYARSFSDPKNHFYYYNRMCKHRKKTEHRVKSQADGPNIISFSSYPAYLHSGDDYYVINSGLVTMETTTGNSNPLLWKYVKPEGEIQEWIRVIIANRLAKSGDDWVNIFKKYNSGTYNNQWMVVNYNKFKPGDSIKKGTLFVLEQLPGMIKYEDKSQNLVTKTYWPSYNIPAFKEIFVASGGPDLVNKYGDWFSYDGSPRAKIFARDHTQIKDIYSMVSLMRYNDYTHDPFSKCNCTPPYSAENAISARNDLNPKTGTYPFSALGHRSHGGTDMKITNSNLVKSLKFKAIAGPTYTQVPVFKWSNQDFVDTPHYGHPNVFKFPLITV